MSSAERVNRHWALAHTMPQLVIRPVSCQRDELRKIEIFANEHPPRHSMPARRSRSSCSPVRTRRCRKRSNCARAGACCRRHSSMTRRFRGRGPRGLAPVSERTASRPALHRLAGGLHDVSACLCVGEHPALQPCPTAVSGCAVRDCHGASRRTSAYPIRIVRRNQQTSR